ncbi:MAG TPA: hypothetical protein VF947_08915, partial [Myxococcales bacterium]
NPPDVQYNFDGEDDFSNEDVGGPLAMDENGIFLAIVVTGQTGDDCLQHSVGGQTIDRKDSLTVDRTAATLNVFTLSAGETEPVMILNTLHSGLCYQFDFVSHSRAVRDAYESIALKILDSFQFGTGPV